MGDGGIDADHQIHRLHQGGGVGEVSVLAVMVQVAVPRQCGQLVRAHRQMQRMELGIHPRQQGRQSGKVGGAQAVQRMHGVARPGEADARTKPRPQVLAPACDALRIDVQVGDFVGNGVDFSTEGARQAHQRGVHIVVRWRVAEHLHFVGHIGKQLEQRPLHLQDHMRTARAQGLEVARHHDGVAQPLFGGQQQDAPARIDVAAPGRVPRVRPPLAHPLVLQPHLKAKPAFTVFAEAELRDGATETGLHVVRIGLQYLVEPGDGLPGFAQPHQGFADAGPGRPERWLDRGGLLRPGQGFRRTVQVQQCERHIKAQFQVAGCQVDAATIILQRLGGAFQQAIRVAAVVVSEGVVGVGVDGRRQRPQGGVIVGVRHHRISGAAKRATAPAA